MSVILNLSEKHLSGNHKILDKDGLNYFVMQVQIQAKQQNLTTLNEIMILSVQMAFDAGFKEGVLEAIKECQRNGVS